MKADLAGVLRDVQLTTLAFAIALGWSLYQFANGVATFVEGVTEHGSAHMLGLTGYIPTLGTELTWVFGGHVFAFGQLVLGLLELGTVLLVATLLRRFSRNG